MDWFRLLEICGFKTPTVQFNKLFHSKFALLLYKQKHKQFNLFDFKLT